MAINTDISSGLAIDANSLNQLKLGAAQSSPEALKAAAQQFEAVFMNMLMKSMRDATPKEGMFDNEQTRMYTSMLDQQLTQRLASRGVGLADVMMRQLSRSMEQSAGEAANQGALNAPGLPLEVKPASGAKPLTAADGQASAALRLTPEAIQAYSLNVPAQLTAATVPASPAASARKGDVPAHVESFVQRLLPHAQAASASSGIPAHFMMGQAALETGWGRAEIRGADGQNSHNLFGIKAGGSWTGRTVDIVTTEYVNGKPQKQVDTFRAYDSYADSFRDYGKLLSGNARYQNVLAAGHNAAGFAQGLQQAGYATDPNYAQKLMSVIRLVETG
ncbi:MAG: flagellar rod assembly protein/muramidase FlgJ [Hydrogenophilales bacterium RIFOXYD1_FULL_62_11]|nr:MAG: flagellar rod assembly protein/muramidase FlgJ [Hydrogenophilales bacterium RIFOXYD1_FULL_62_11]